MITALALFVSAALAAPPTPPEPPEPPSSGERGGRMSGRDDDAERLMKHFPEIAERLGLSAEQKTAVEKLYYDSKSTGIDLKAKGEKSRLELERLMLGDTLDEKAVLKAFEAAAVAETAVRRNDLKLMLGIRKQLTAEQWAGLRAMRDERRGGKRGRGGPERDDDREGGERGGE
jgi:Spy/CpxP family protein refolding chaperone